VPPDGVTPLEETLATLDDFVTEGTVRYLGSSNFAGWQIADAEWIARTQASGPVHLGAESLQPAAT
jgi:aryl-alcohol dehydrogenase-like predicted oxidoreductase